MVRLSDARNVKTRREVQQYVSILASNLSNYPEDLRVLGAIVARKTPASEFSYNHAKTEQVRVAKSRGYTSRYSKSEQGAVDCAEG